MPCTVKITGGKSDISLEKIHVKMLFDTEEKHVFLKSNSIGATVTIFGRINQARKESLVEMFDWSRDFTVDGVYRKVEITETQGTDALMRTYIFPQMFILSYEEFLGEGNDSTFNLVLKQKEDELQTIETY